jgi:hypothetical protein
MTPNDCRNFETCNVPVCPLAPQQGRYLSGERVCVYALASGKAGAAERYGSFPEFHEVCRNLPVLTARFPSIGRAIEQAALLPLRPDQSANLRRRRIAETGVCGPVTLSKRPQSRPRDASRPRMPRNRHENGGKHD